MWGIEESYIREFYVIIIEKRELFWRVRGVEWPE